MVLVCPRRIVVVQLGLDTTSIADHGKAKGSAFKWVFGIARAREHVAVHGRGTTAASAQDPDAAASNTKNEVRRARQQANKAQASKV